MIEPPHPLLAQGKVRHVGDPVAVVVAETLEQAKDAAELIEVSYKTLPAVVTSQETIKPGSPLLFDTAPGNLCFDWHLGDKTAVDAAFSRAHHITRLDLVNNRLVSNPMEPRAATGEFDRGTSEYTLYTTSQAPHVHRLLIAAFVLQLPEHKLRVVAPDVGGGFGTKGSLYAEQALVLWLAGKLGRPVKWTAERSEIFLTDNSRPRGAPCSLPKHLTSRRICHRAPSRGRGAVVLQVPHHHRRRVALGPSEKHRSTWHARNSALGDLRHEGRDRHDGLLEPGRHRLRAMCQTSITP
jgi:CO/xanthine dehydrogenase Mo-binding subunit